MDVGKLTIGRPHSAVPKAFVVGTVYNDTSRFSREVPRHQGILQSEPLVHEAVLLGIQREYKTPATGWRNRLEPQFSDYVTLQGYA